jgi:predicted permease
MFGDLRHLARNLRRAPASAAAAVITLALTLGAGASIFALVDAVLLTPPPFADPDRLVRLGEVPLEEASTAAPRPVTYATFEAWRARGAGLGQLEAFDGTNLTLTGIGAPQRLSATVVTPGFLPLLGVHPARGRAFTADDIAQPVAMLSHSFWQTMLGGDANVIGRSIVLGGRPVTVVGVLPEQFWFLDRSDVWLPLPMTAAQAEQTGFRVLVMARLAAPGVNITEALDAVSRENRPPLRVVATPVTVAAAGRASATLTLLLAGAGLTVLMAIANLAALLIVRGIDRQGELSVRLALGARTSDIVRELLVESHMLVVGGAVGGILVALWLTPAAARFATEIFGADVVRDVPVSWRVIGALTLAALVCAAVCGLVPALSASRTRAVALLRRGNTTAPKELAVRRAFVTAQIAVAFVLIASMTLIGRSLNSVLRVEPGFDANGVFTMKLSTPPGRYPNDADVAQFYARLQAVLRDRFGDGRVSILDEMPLTHDRGRAPVAAQPGGVAHDVVLRTPGTDYFDVMRIGLVAGREFDDRDDAGAPRRVVISESLARRLFGSEPAVGRDLFFGASPRPLSVIGVVRDVKFRALDERTIPSVYVSASQVPSRSTNVVVRVPMADSDVLAIVRQEVGRLDPDLPVYGSLPMPDIVATSPGVPARRVLAATFTAFAVLAVVLGALGLFGVIAHDVARRRSELALRLALGAAPHRVLIATLRQAAQLLAFGVLIGAVLSTWASGALREFLFEVGPYDPLTLVAVAALLSLVGLAAVLPAARRAARVDPMQLLREGG